MRTSRLVALPVMLIAALLAVNSSDAQLPAGGSRVVRACDQPSDCVPDSISIVLLYVHDATDRAIADMPVSAISTNRSTGTVNARTDRHGMAALTVTPGQPYQVRVEAPGWIPLTTEERIPAKGAVEVLRIEMRVPSIH